jgi:hypothetical protein
MEYWSIGGGMPPLRRGPDLHCSSTPALHYSGINLHGGVDHPYGTHIHSAFSIF